MITLWDEYLPAAGTYRRPLRGLDAPCRTLAEALHDYRDATTALDDWVHMERLPALSRRYDIAEAIEDHYDLASVDASRSR